MKQQPYNHLKIEKKWQKAWEAKDIYKTSNNSKKKPYYVLDMFPYPSGQGLHVGHPRGYIGSDVFARMKRMQGFNVLHPMGFDAFGLPAEQYAIQTGKHPSIITKAAIARYKKQLEIIGFSYDWSREVQTIDPEYYKWTQWIFLQIYDSWYDKKKNKARSVAELVTIFEKSGNSDVDAFCDADVKVFSAKEWKAFSEKQKQDMLMKYRLAYEGYAEVNWCAELGTVLANDEVLEKDGKLVSERGDYPVERKSMRQWFMRITAYADRLISGLDLVDFADSTKETQKNWIGKSEGSEITFNIVIPKRKILIGTRNEAKFQMVKNCFPTMEGIELISLNDIPAVDDSALVEGSDFRENARMKAKFYFEKTGIPTISTDNVFWVEKWPKDNGVIVHMRKEANPESERATDDEVVAYFDTWIEKHGPSKAHFIFALAYADHKGVQETESTQREYILQNKTVKDFPAGYPMEHFLKDAKTGEFKREQKDEIRYDKLIEKLKDAADLWLGAKKQMTVFTTRVDTLFGVTYVVLAPEHKLVQELLQNCENKKEVEKYIEIVKNKIQEERTESKEKTGVELKGVYAINPANGEHVPVWIADYVLASYGTGAVMAVPAHDERDFEFAKKYNLPVKYVINPVFVRGDVVGKTDFQEKQKIVSIVEDGKGNVLTINWGSKLGGRLFLGGTVEKGESPQQTALRELAEETGYTDAEVLHVSEETFDYKYFALSKNIAYQAFTKFVHVKLRSLEKKEVALEENEKDKFTVEWISYNQAGKEVVEVLHNYAFNKYILNQCFTGYGVLDRSARFDGLTSEQAKKEITKFVGGKFVTKYKMRDAIFARQRYWGEPIPLIHKNNGTTIQEEKLPLTLPNVKSYAPTQTGESPLAGISNWVNLVDPTYDKKKTKYIIFDFDGVIGDTYKLNLKARIVAGWASNMEESIRYSLDYFSTRPHHAKGHSYTKEEIKDLVDRCKLFGQVILEGGIPLFDGFVKEIKKIKNAKIAIVSSGTKNYIIPGMKKTGIKIDGIQTYEDSLSKEDKIEYFAKKWKVDVKDIYYVTDANSDVYELENLLDREKIIGCSWGYLGKEKLLETLPEDQILNKFGDIHKVFEPKMVRRETNTMPGWAGSSWYFLRYMDPKNKKALVGEKEIKYWKNVDMYVGGTEHNTGHLLYARFWHKFLYDIGVAKTEEPFKALRHQGMIGGADGRKMSKRWGNVVNPDDVVKTYGADTLRVFEMFLGPFEGSLPWSTEGIIGSRRFIERVWRLGERVLSENYKKTNDALTTILHKTIKKVTEDIQSFNFNTAVSSMMIFVNEAEKEKELSIKDFKLFLAILAPFASHMADELWQQTGEKTSIHLAPWPKYNQKFLIESSVTIAVQINGKMRGTITAPVDATQDAIVARVHAQSTFDAYLKDKEIKKIIYVNGKLISFVV